MDITLSIITEFVLNELLVMPELSGHKDSLNVYLTGSRAAGGGGGYSGQSDVDLDIVCPRPVFDQIQKNFLRSGKT
ncbi:MAG: hypothetical protein FWD53_11320, partial [Phycisphaerales bacterium]|nr:hypothetical protein [Phycisphaerales bacterium]